MDERSSAMPALAPSEATDATEFAPTKIQRTLIGDQVYAILWQQIVSHKLLPGDKLSDLRLSEELGVSRTPVREALFRLSQDGIVRAGSRRGFTVATFSTEDVREVYDIRTALEVMAIRLAYPNLTRAQIDAAQEAHDLASQRVAQGHKDAREHWFQVDRDFHHMLVASTGNKRLLSMLDTLRSQVRVFHVYVTHRRPIQQRVIDQHCLIIEGLRQKTSKAAEDAMEQHIQSLKDHLLNEFVQHETTSPV